MCLVYVGLLVSPARPWHSSVLLPCCGEGSLRPVPADLWAQGGSWARSLQAELVTVPAVPGQRLAARALQGCAARTVSFSCFALLIFLEEAPHDALSLLLD